MNKLISSLILSAIFIFAAQQNAKAQITPGGVDMGSNNYLLDLWVVGDNTTSTNWPNVGSANYTLAKFSTNAPITQNGLNFHKEMYFGNTASSKLRTTATYPFTLGHSYYVFVVSDGRAVDEKGVLCTFYNSEESHALRWNDGSANILSAYWSGTQRIPNWAGTQESKVGIATLNIRNSHSAPFDMYLNGNKYSTSLSTGLNGTGASNRNTNMMIGNGSSSTGTGNTSGFNGSIQEIILIRKTSDAAMPDADLQKIHTCLAIKYGLTLGSNYVISDGTVVWNRSTGNNSAYSNNIIGIGRDDASGLHQKQTVGPDNALTMYLGNLAALNADNIETVTDKNFTMLGSNGQPAGLVQPFTLFGDPDINMRSQRIYKVQLTGANAPTAVNLKVNALPAKYLIVSPNENLSGGTLYTLDANGNADGVAIQNNDYIGFAMYMKYPGNMNIANVTPIAWFTPDQYSNGSWTNRILSNGTVGNFTQPSSWTDKTPPATAPSANFHPAVQFRPAGTGNALHRMISDNMIGINNDESFSIIMVLNRTQTGYAEGNVLNYSTGTNYTVQHNLNFRSTGNNTLTAGWTTQERTLGAVPLGSTQLLTVDNNNTDGIRMYLGAEQKYTAASTNGSANTPGVSGNDLNNYKIVMGGSHYDIAGNGERSFSGDIQELIILKKNRSSNPFLIDANTQTEFNKVHSYLAVKYGITMTDRSYLASNGTTVWDRSTNTGYNSAIFGLARDDASALYQKQAVSSQDNALTVYLDALQYLNKDNAGTIAADKTYLMLGSNGLAVNSTQGYDPGVHKINMRLNRMYRAQSTTGATPQTVNIKLANSVQAQYLVVSDNAALTPGVNTTFYPINNGVATDVQIKNGDFIGFALVVQMPGNVSATALPIAWFTPDRYFGGVWQNRILTTGTVGDFRQGTWTSKTAPATVAGANFHSSLVFTPASATAAPHRMISDNTIGIGTDEAFSILLVFNRTQYGYDNGNILNYSTGSNYTTQHNVSFRANSTDVLSAGWLTDARALGNVPIASPQLVTIDNNNTNAINWYLGGTLQAGSFASANGSANSTTDNDNKIVLGGSHDGLTGAGARSFTGNVQEVIILKRKIATSPFLEALNLQKLHSYLAVKYGFTLNHDYLASNGTTTVWQLSANTGYNTVIFGIGRDDDYALYQKQSRATGSTGSVFAAFVGNSLLPLNSSNTSGTLDDGQYVMFGTDGTSVRDDSYIHANGTIFASGALDAPNGLNYRRGTVYKTQLTGTSSINVKLSMQGPIHSYCLVSKNASFTPADTKVYPVSVTGVVEIELDANYKFIDFAGYRQTGIAPGGVNTGVNGATLKLWFRADVRTSLTTEQLIVSNQKGISKTVDYPDAPAGSEVTGVSEWEDIVNGVKYTYAASTTTHPQNHLEPVYQQSNYMTNYHPALRFWANWSGANSSSHSAYLSNAGNIWNTALPTSNHHSAFFLGNNYYNSNPWFYPLMFGKTFPNEDADSYRGPGYGVGKNSGNMVGRFRTYNNTDDASNGSVNLFAEGATTILGYHPINGMNKSGSVAASKTWTRFRFNGKQDYNHDISTSDFGLNRPSAMGTGYRHNRSLVGVMSEAIMYDGELVPAEIEQIESYLALKYGITLRSSTSPYSRFHYKFSDNSTVWNGDAVSGNNVIYYNRIAAVIRDDAAGLNNRQSHSTDVGSILHMGVPGTRLGTHADVGAFANNMEAIVWGDDNAGGTTQVQTEVCGDFTHVFNRIWMVRKIANSNLLMLVGAQDNIGTQLDKDSDIPSRNLMAFLKKGYDVTMMVADDPDKLRPLHANYGGFTAVPMTFMDGEQQCTHVFTDEITYLTFGYKANQTGCVSDVQFDGVKTFPWTQWTRQNYGANLNSGVSKGSYWLSDGIEVVSTTVKYDNGVNAPANYPSVTNSPTANALYIQRRRGAKNSKVTVTIEFNEPVRAEFSIYDIDGYARQHEGVTVTGECPSGGVIPQLSYAGSPLSSIYTITGNTAISNTSTWVSPTSRNAQVNVSFSTGVTKVIIEYFVTTDGNQAVSSVVRNLMISPIRIRQIPPPPTTNEDHLYFEKEVKNDELISTCEIPEYEFVIGNENCADKIVNLRDTLPAGLIWESVSIGSGTVSGLTTRYLSIDNITVPGSGELIFRATASFDIVAAGGAGSFPKQFDNRGWILYQRQTQSGNEDVKLPSEERTTHAPYASFTAYYEVKKQPVTSSITAVNPAKYVSDGEIEFTITANNPNPPISNVYIDVAYNANFVYGGFFQPSTLSAVLVGTPDSSLTVAGNVDGSVGFLLPTGTSTYKFRLKAPADADLVPDPDEIGKILDLAIQYVFSDGNGNPCEMVDTEGDATVPFSALKTFDDLATTTVNTQVTIPVLDNDEIPSDCLPVAPVPVTSLYTHHGTHILCNTDKICYTPDNGYAGIDSADYSVSCPPNTDTSRIYFVVLDGYTLYNVCSGKDVTMSFGAITDVELYWYSVQTGGTANPLTPTNSKALTGVTTGQTWWVEPHWKGKIFPRQQVQINIINTPTLGAISSNPSPLWICDNEQLTASHLNMPTINWNGATGSGSWQLETGVGTGTYTDITLPTNITYADNGKSIRYHASNTCGETSSIPIMLNVRPPLANDITVSADQSVCGVIPNPLTSSLPSGGNGVYTYQWEYSTNSGGTWTNISGATSATYTFSSPPASTIWYRLKVTSCNSTVTSTNYVVITVSSGFDAGAITVSDPNPICYNAEMPSMELSTLPVVSTGTYSVIWQEKTSSGGTWNDIIGTAGFTSYPYGYSSLTATRWYRVLVTNHGVSGNCTQQATNEIEITVYPVPTVNPVSSQTVCNGSATTAINFTTTIVPPPTVTYSWTNSDPSIGLGASGTGNIASFTATNSTTAPKTATITVTPKIGTCEGTQETFTITVLPTPTVDVIANQRVCRDDLTAAVNFTTTISGVTVDYEWMHTNAAVGLNTTSGSGTFPSFTATNTTNAPISTTVTVTPKISSGGATCTGAQKTFTITVNPKPAISTTFTRIICNNNGTFTVSPANGTDGIVPTGTKYSWNAPSHSDITGMTGGTDANSISGGPLTNTSTSAQVVTYNVTPSVEFGGLTCTGAQFTVDVTVYAPVTAGTIQSDQTICPGGTLSPLTTATPPGGGNGSYSYFWEYDNGSNGSSWTSAPGTNNTASYQPGVLAGVYKYRRQVTGCGVTVTSSNVVTVTVSSGINPGTITPLVPAHICHNTAAPTLTLNPVPSGGAGTLTYRWQYSTASDSGPWADVPNTDNSSYSPGTLTATTWYRVLVTDPAVTGACSEAATNVVQVLVIPFQSITNKTVDICSGNILHITPQDGVDGDVVPPLTFLNYYKWTVSPASNPSVVSGQSDVSMHGVVGGDQTLINHTSSVQTVTYYVTPVTTMGGTECEGAQFTVTVKVNPKPSAGNINMRICSGDTFDATPTDGGGNIVPASNVYYRWNAVYTSGTLSGVSSEVVGQTAISQTPVNLTSSVQTVVYTAYPIYDANNNGNTFDNEDCYGSAFTVTVDVNPVPAINNITMEICSGSIFTAGPSDVSDGTVPAGTKYTWTVIPASGAIISGQSDQTVPQNSISDGPLTNHTALQQTVTYNVTPIFTDGGKTCAGNIFTVAVTVTDLPTAGTLSYNSGTEICKSSGTVLPTWMPNPPTGGGTSSYTVTYADPPASTLTIDPITGNITPGTSDTGTYIVEYEMSAANSCNGFTRTATVKIADVPAVSNIVFTLVPLCDGASLTSTLLNPTPTVTPNNAVTTEGWEIETAAGSGSYVVLNLPHTVSYADNGKKIRYTATNVCGSTSSANTVTLTVMPIPKYSDIRLQVCSQPVPRSIYLSSYLDTLNVTAISWSAVAGPALESATVNTTGELRITAGFPLGISTYKCHVTHKCTTADVLVYVKNLANPVISPSLKDTVVVCQYLSEASHLQMNQIMGLEANGTWNYNTADLGAYITHVLAPSQYAGAYVFDAAAAWSALNGNASYNITYNGDTQATRFVFTYTTPSQSCFGSKTRELVIIVTSKLLP